MAVNQSGVIWGGGSKMKAFFVYKFSKRASKKCNSSKIITKCAINFILDVSTCSIQE